jgi:hypothetical protein
MRIQRSRLVCVRLARRGPSCVRHGLRALGALRLVATENVTALQHRVTCAPAFIYDALGRARVTRRRGERLGRADTSANAFGLA